MNRCLLIVWRRPILQEAGTPLRQVGEHPVVCGSLPRTGEFSLATAIVFHVLASYRLYAGESGRCPSVALEISTSLVCRRLHLVPAEDPYRDNFMGMYGELEAIASKQR